MSISEKHFIALADQIKEHNKGQEPFTPAQVMSLARFCREQNPNFMGGSLASVY